MSSEVYSGAWNLVYSTVRAFWALVEPQIHAAAKQQDVPLELYYYAELGLDVFSARNFQERDPYSNPALYAPVFAKLAQAEWIIPLGNDAYRVTADARAAVRQIVRVGDAYLGALEVLSGGDLERLHELLQRIVRANQAAAEPPTKWATVKRFHAADESSPLLAQIREALLDLFAYRDDSHRTAWRAFPADGLTWHTFNLLWDNTADTPADMARQASFRGYAPQDYARACESLIARGWAARGERAETFVLTPIGKRLRDAVEKLTDAYFFLPWASLPAAELDELLSRQRQLRERLEAVALNAR